MKQILFLALALCAFAAVEAQIAVNTATNTIVNQQTGKQQQPSPEALKKLSVLPVYTAPTPYWSDTAQTIVVLPTSDGQYAVSIFIRENYGKKPLDLTRKRYPLRQQTFIFAEPITNISRIAESCVRFTSGAKRYECKYQEPIPAQGFRWILSEYYPMIRM